VSDSVPDRSMIPTGDLFYIDLGIVVNRGGELVVEEMEESNLIRHQRGNDFNLSHKDARVRYWIGADVGCPECSDVLFDYLSYYPEDRERYVDEDGDFDWELMQSDLENDNGMIGYAFQGDRGSKTDCANCEQEFFYTNLMDHMIHADGGGNEISPLRGYPRAPVGRSDTIVHGFLCDPCMEWFKSTLVKGRIVK